MTIRGYAATSAAGWLAVLLFGCGESGNPPTAPDARKAAAPSTPTVATDLGPANEGAGCSFEGAHSSSAFDVNTAATVVGVTDCLASETLTFRWSRAAGMEFLANFPGGYGTLGGSINSAGNIAALFSTNNVFYDLRPIIWTPGNVRIDLVDVVSCDPEINPEVVCRSGFPVHFINDRDHVVGIHDEAPYRWTRAAGLTRLPELDGRTPIAINRHGDIAGTDFANSVILLANGSLTSIAGLSGTDMNDKRDVVGAVGGLAAREAALWSKSKGIQRLGTLGGSESIANGINNHGEVVGASTDANGAMRAFYWIASRGMVDLGPGIANAISDEGHIVGLAPAGDPENWHATLWTGTGGVSPAVNARSARAPSPRTSACYADAKAWRSKAEMFRCLAGHR
jgi:probable HAF family extracellular repeat protein